MCRTRRDFLAASATTLGALLLPEAAANAAEQETVGRDPLLASTNPVIVKARDAALEVLKPTRAQLEHGLGAAPAVAGVRRLRLRPRAAVDGAALAALDEAGASDLELQDARKKWG